MTKALKIGTRGSPLALAQTDLVIAGLQKAHPGLICEKIVIITTGDKSQAGNRPLSDSGGKGDFTKEIEDALIAGEIDCAVHSMKDMPTKLPEGLVIDCMLPREDVRDAFFTRDGKTLAELPAGAVVGTSSLRRQAIILAQRPDLKTVVFRGNVGTRLQKLKDGIVDATVLAVAGLKRLGMENVIQTILEPDIMLPAPAQGAVGVERRIVDKATAELLEKIHCPVTELRVTAERAFLEDMDGSCRTPLAALMSEPDPEGRARFEALYAKPDGSQITRVSMLMSVAHKGDAIRLGKAAAEDIKKRMKD